MPDSDTERGRTFFHCDFRFCSAVAEWAYIGEAGDYYLCDAHYTPADNWVRVRATAGETP